MAAGRCIDGLIPVPGLYEEMRDRVFTSEGKRGTEMAMRFGECFFDLRDPLKPSIDPTPVLFGPENEK